jgi:transposase
MGSPTRQNSEPGNVSSLFKKCGGRYKRIRKRVKQKPSPQLYADRLERLALLETLALEGKIDLLYGDESRVSSEGYVPYGWQFPGESVSVLAQRGYHLNCFGLISRRNQCHWATTTATINADFVARQLEELSWGLLKETVVVLDCARIHTGRLVRDRLLSWQRRGLFVFYLPPYSPHLNLAETLWRKLKREWLRPEDYLEKDTLFYAVNRCLANVGHELGINFSPFNLS